MTPDSWPQLSIAVLIATTCAYLISKAVGAGLEAFGRRLGEQAATETLERAPALARWVIELGIRRLPAEHRDRYRQEWLAELEAKSEMLGENTPLSLLAEAMRLASAAPQMARELRRAGLRIAPLTTAFRVYVAILCLATVVFLPAGLAHAFANPATTLLWIAFIAAANFRNVAMLPKVDVTATLEGESWSGLQAVVIPGGGGAVIGLPADTAEQSLKSVEAAASLLGMALQRLDG